MTTGVSITEQNRFIDVMIYSCADAARANNLPLAAMIACAVVESGYGTSKIYNATGVPFNLQKPSSYSHVHCDTVTFRTCVKTDAAGKCIGWAYASFCYAAGEHEFAWLRDAARIWCEWVLGWPNVTNRNNVLSWRNRPTDFARYLPFLGFGEFSKRTQNGESFVQALRKHALFERCMFE